MDNALDMTGRPHLSAGVLDFDLGGTNSSAICWKLFDRRIAFVFHTGRHYTALRQWPTAPVILKPATTGLISTLVGLFR